MKRGKIYILSSVLMIAMLLTACGTAYPELSDKEYDYVTEYAAGLLMQHTYNQINRLDASAMAHVSDSSAAGVSAGEGLSQTAGENQSLNQGSNQNAGTTMSGTSGAGTAMSGTSGEGAAMSGTSGAGAAMSGTSGAGASSDLAASSMTDIKSALNGLDLKYTGYSVMKSYPSYNAQGAVYSSDGASLVVADFTLTNNTDKAIVLNVRKNALTFRMKFDDTSLYTLVTMLNNDLGTYSGTIESGSSKKVVLITELDDKSASSIDGITLRIKNRDIDSSIDLETS